MLERDPAQDSNVEFDDLVKGEELENDLMGEVPELRQIRKTMLFPDDSDED